MCGSAGPPPGLSAWMGDMCGSVAPILGYQNDEVVWSVPFLAVNSLSTHGCVMCVVV